MQHHNSYGSIGLVWQSDRAQQTMAQQTKWARMKNPKHIWKWNSLAQKLHSNLGPSSRIRFQVPSHSKLFSLFYFCEISLLFSCGTTVFNRWLQAQHTEAEWKLMLRPRECFVMQFLCPRNRNMHCLVWVRVQGRVVHENKFRNFYGCLFELPHHSSLVPTNQIAILT